MRGIRVQMNGIGVKSVSDTMNGVTKDMYAVSME